MLFAEVFSPTVDSAAVNNATTWSVDIDVDVDATF